jgi:hypothetical protein
MNIRILRRHVKINITYLDQRLLTGLKNYAMDSRKVLPHKSWDRITTGQYSLHFPRQGFRNLKKHVVWQHIGGALVLIHGHVEPPSKNLLHCPQLSVVEHLPRFTVQLQMALVIQSRFDVYLKGNNLGFGFQAELKQHLSADLGALTDGRSDESVGVHTQFPKVTL